MEAQTINQGISEADRLFRENVEKSRIIQETNLLNDDQKEWLKAGEELFLQCSATSYIREIEETMDSLIYLNGIASDIECKDPVEISRMYYMLKCLRDAFRKMEKIKNLK